MVCKNYTSHFQKNHLQLRSSKKFTIKNEIAEFISKHRPFLGGGSTTVVPANFEIWVASYGETDWDGIFLKIDLEDISLISRFHSNLYYQSHQPTG
jgi:hypothetical protein